MSKQTRNHKPRHIPKSSQLDFHYFLLNVTNNGDGSVQVDFSQIQPVPDGNVVKWVMVLRRNGGPFPVQGPYGIDGLIEIEGSIAAGDIGGETTIPSQSFKDILPDPGTYTYNITGEFGVPGDTTSMIEMGSNWFTITI